MPHRQIVQRRRSSGPRGYTLVELITILVIIGIIGAVVMPRFFQRQSFDARSFADQSLGMIRYAQKLAIAQNRPVFVRLDNASVALCFSADCAVANRAVPPAGANTGSKVTLAACQNADNWLCEGMPAGISYTTAPATASFYFDALGKPFASIDVFPAPVSTFPARLTVSIGGGGQTRQIMIESETGYVH